MKIKVLALLLTFLIIPFFIGACDGNGAEDPVEMAVLDLSITGEGEVDGLTEGENQVEQGAVVELKAKPAEGWTFSEWLGNVQEADDKETSISMESDEEVEVVFEGNINVDYLAGPSETYHGLYWNYFFEVQNLTDEEVSEVFTLHFNNRKVDELSIDLEAGEIKEIAFYNHSSDLLEDEDLPGTYPIELKRDGQVLFDMDLEINVEDGAYYRFAGPREPPHTEWGEDDDHGEYYMVYHQIANVGDEKEEGGTRLFWLEDEDGEKVDIGLEESLYVLEMEPLELEPGDVYKEALIAWPELWELESGEYTVFIEIKETGEKISSTFTW